MADVRPFRALRPPADLAARVASLPYDVMDTAEARTMAADDPLSFLHVSRPEIDLPESADPYSSEVYAQGRRALEQFVAQGWLVRDGRPTYSVYRQRRDDHVQTGVVGLASVDEYESGAIAVHELTRPEKEDDRVRHLDALDAQDEPVFLLAARNEAVEAVIAAVTARPPAIDLVSDDGIGHTIWVVGDEDEVAALRDGFASLPRLYVADGHHRSAAAARVRAKRSAAAGGAASAADHFLAVVFAADELAILPYHRVVADRGGRDADDLLVLLDGPFAVSSSDGPPVPSRRHEIGLYLGGRWYRLVLRGGLVDESDPVARLDVQVLQDHVLAPLLGILDPRTDPRLRFVGGIRGTAELERLVDTGQAAAAFALHPTSVDDLVALADAGLIMPPKSTWFEPKLRSGLFVHALWDDE